MDSLSDDVFQSIVPRVTGENKSFLTSKILAASEPSRILVRMNEPWQEHFKAPDEASLQRLATIVYILQAASLVTGSLTLFAGVIINYVRWQDVQGSWIESHFRWQTRTFWFTIVWLAVGVVTTIFLFGWVILLAVSLWLIYRLVKGWTYLSEHRPIP